MLENGVKFEAPLAEPVEAEAAIAAHVATCAGKPVEMQSQDELEELDRKRLRQMEVVALQTVVGALEMVVGALEIVGVVVGW